jgi:hypothetical protein
MKKKTKKFAGRITNGSLVERSEYLRKLADSAFNNKHYLESSIIYFQTVEFSLRLVIHLLSIRNGLSRRPMDEIEKERNFPHLVLYLDLLKPGNIFSQRLLRFNNSRNNFMHKLYFAESVEFLETGLKNFCIEGKDLIHHLLQDIGLVED